MPLPQFSVLQAIGSRLEDYRATSVAFLAHLNGQSIAMLSSITYLSTTL